MNDNSDTQPNKNLESADEIAVKKAKQSAGPYFLIWCIVALLFGLAAINPGWWITQIGRVGSESFVQHNLVMILPLCYSGVGYVIFHKRQHDHIVRSIFNVSMVALWAAIYSVNFILHLENAKITAPQWDRCLVLGVGTIIIMLEFSVVVYRWSQRVTVPLIVYFGSLYVQTIAAFAGFYTYLATLGPQEFVGLNSRDRFQMLFYSTSILTTTGLGTIAPLSQSAQVLSTLEMLGGLFLNSVVIAMLVSKALSSLPSTSILELIPSVLLEAKKSLSITAATMAKISSATESKDSLAEETPLSE